MVPLFDPVRAAPPRVPRVNVAPDVPLSVSNETEVMVWALPIATLLNDVLKMAVSAGFGFDEVDQLLPVFQSFPLAPVQVTLAALADWWNGNASSAVAAGNNESGFSREEIGLVRMDRTIFFDGVFMGFFKLQAA